MADVYPNKEHQDWARRIWLDPPPSDADGITEISAIELDIRCADQSLRTVLHRGIKLNEIAIGIAVFEDISDRRKIEDTLRRIAYEDPLTGLSNRRALQELWQQVARDMHGTDTMTAVLLVDLDGFKRINDTLGHDAGDDTLIAVAERLRDSVRGGDLVCRIGGDEFAILVPGLHDSKLVEQMCWRIGVAMSLPIMIHGKPIIVRASIGASLHPQDGNELQGLLKRADEALYRRKAERHGGWEWFREPNAA
ncbi:GGDEF domain-containing protein [Aureimonas altamirensis]|nr:GGDEF domain-containing protein [Aureimonas altamirensis]